MPKKQQYRLFYIALTAIFILFFYKGCISRPEIPNRNAPQLSANDVLVRGQVQKNAVRSSCSLEEYDDLAQKAENKAKILYEEKDEKYELFIADLSEIAGLLKENPENLLEACQKLDIMLDETEDSAD